MDEQKRIKIVYFGYLIAPLKAAIDSKVSIKGVVIEPKLKKTKDMLAFCKKKEIKTFEAGKINTNLEIVEMLRGIDVAIVGAFSQIFPQKILEVPQYGFCNIHFSYLPYYKGNNPMEWMIINGEKSGGVTFHWMLEEVDEGDIVIQSKIPISPEDDYSSLYDKCLKKSYSMAKTLFAKNPDKWPRKNQKLVEGEYHRKRTEKDWKINKNMSVDEIDRLIKAEAWKDIIFFSSEGDKYIVKSYILTEGNHDGQNGEILNISGNRISISFQGKVAVFSILKGNSTLKVGNLID